MNIFVGYCHGLDFSIYGKGKFSFKINKAGPGYDHAGCRVAVYQHLPAGAHSRDRECAGAPTVTPLTHHGGDIPAGNS